MELDQASHRRWRFALKQFDVGQLRFEALRTPKDLWIEGVAMSHCLYALRNLCDRDEPSRFFSVQRQSRRVATAELQLDVYNGTWFLREVRASCNRVPDPAIVEAAALLAEAYSAAAHRSAP